MPARSSYLLKSRHGVYYFRIRVPISVRQRRQLPTRRQHQSEIRVSLNTKDAKAAIYLARKRWIAMQDQFSLPPWEEEAEVASKKYSVGRALVQKHQLDPHHEFDLNELSERLLPEQLEAYIFAWEFDDRAAAARYARRRALQCEIPVRPTDVQPEPDRDVPLTEAVERFLQSKTDNVAAKTLKSYRTKCAIFCHVLAEANDGQIPRMSGITASMVQRYHDVMRELPRGFVYEQSTRICELVRGSYPTLDTQTRNFHFRVVKHLLTWLEAQHYPILRDLPTILGKLKSKGNRRRIAFPQGDLVAIFNSQEYLKGTFKRSVDYWIPLLGVFTGARQSELCQLHADDVYQDASTSLWVIDINQKYDKTLKSGESNARKIPIHSQLKKLGFLEFVDSVRQQGKLRLFADEQRTEDGEFAAFSKRFNRFKEELGIKSDSKHRRDFHSFRHNVSGFLVQKACPPYIINAITGHSQSGESLAVVTYSEGPGLRAVAEWVERLQYNVDFSLVRPNGWRKKLHANRRNSIEI